MRSLPGAKRTFREAVIVIAITSAGYLVDQLTKIFMTGFLEPGNTLPLIPNILHLTLVNNTGAAFGMFRSFSFVFVPIALAAVLFLTIFLFVKRDTLPLSEKVALSLFLAGVLGNLTDRLRLGYVIDFIDMRVWPVFNVADSLITVGAAVLVAATVLNGMKIRKERVKDLTMHRILFNIGPVDDIQLWVFCSAVHLDLCFSYDQRRPGERHGLNTR